MSVIKMTPLQKRAYKLLREGNAQSLVAKIIKKAPGTVCKIASKLEKQGFIARKTVIKPYLYEEGSRSRELDDVIVAESLESSADSDVATDGTPVKRVSSQAHSVQTILSHHVDGRFWVEEVGLKDHLEVKARSGTTTPMATESVQIPLLRKEPHYNYHNRKRWGGTLWLDGEHYTIVYEETAKVRWLYVYPPQKDGTFAEAAEYERFCADRIQRVGNYIEKYGGWKLGVLEMLNQNPHFAIDSPEYLKNLIEKMTITSEDGKVYLSDSEGRSEIEFRDLEDAMVYVSIPKWKKQTDGTLQNHSNEIYELRQRIVSADEIGKLLDIMIENQRKNAEIEFNRMSKEAVENLAHANGNGGHH